MFIAVPIIIGVSGLVAQVLLLRELLVGFCGNELTVGVILANWIILEAAGALIVGRLIDKATNREAVFVILNSIFIIAFPLCIWAVHSFRSILGLSPGLAIGIGSVFWISLIVSLPLGFTHGALFSSWAKIDSVSIRAGVISSARVYFWETLGTILAGLLLTYILIQRFNSFQIGGGLAVLNLLVCLYVLYKKIIGWHLLKLFTTALLLLFVCLLFTWQDFYNNSINRQWQGYRVLDYANSPYGNIVVTKSHGQYTFFFNGQPAITTPYPDIIPVEEFANIPLLFHKHPKRILVISAGAGGLINAILKHPSIRQVDYVELDPLILNMVMKHLTGLVREELGDARVKVINSDGRLFLRQTNSQYDVILLGIPGPSDLQTNRLFTEEFFKLAKNKLIRGGILAFRLAGSTTYLNTDLKDLNASILNSLKGAFSYVRTIPGEFNLFLASDYKDISSVDSSLIIRRIQQRGLENKVLLPDYVQYRLGLHWQVWFDNMMRYATKIKNRDFSGFALFKAISVWNSQFNPALAGVFAFLEGINLLMILGLILGLTLIFLIINFKKAAFSRFAVPYAIATTGFFGMSANLLIIFCFQVVYGYLYSEIGILIAVFMSGAASGSIIISRYLGRLKNALWLFFGSELAIILSVPIILFCLSSGPSRAIFFMLCFLSGFWTGLQFPLANKIYLNKGSGFGATIGMIYSADLLGGWLAGILSGLLFFPLLGLFATCMIVLALKLSSFLFLGASYKKKMIFYLF